ncbi:hypothetical protein HOLleu_24777 [Holothuria leucospilota]|uniref:Uncharacterized protein n=1 Tax=Holothuria leucospilota TaxID=206669 RepID=A0A9Q1BRY4_HOLLE|nr:hypothetical protein HOLleu_24777 [Holothuria leucospilota]
MEDYQREALVDCFINSYVVFEPLDVTNNLLESAILDDDEVTKIENETLPWSRVQLLIAFVNRKAGCTFENLTDALKSCGKYCTLVKDLETSAAFLQKYNTKVEELVQCSSPGENFMYLDMLMSIAVSLDINDSLEICKHLSLSDECIAIVEKNKNPGLATMNICRKTRIVKVSSVQAFRNVFKSLSLAHQLASVDRYIKALEHPELELEVTKTEPDVLLETVKEIFRDRKTWFKVAKKIETLEPQIQDDVREDYVTTKIANVPHLPGALGPEIIVTITRSFPDTLLSLLRRAINDKTNFHIRGRPLRTFFYQYFEDILCTNIRDGSNGVQFVLKIAKVSALHRLYTAILNGKLAEDMLLTVQDTIGDNRVRRARMCVELDEDDYTNAQKYFEPSKTLIGHWGLSEEDKSPGTTNQGNPSDPLFVDPESFEMIQRLHQERQDYENALLRSGAFESK